MRKKKFSGFGVGSTSIIMIFIVLCLTTFSILSFVSSNVGYNFAQKSKEHTQMFYDAQLRATEVLSQIDTTLYAASSDPSGYNNYIFGLQNFSGIKVVQKKDSFTVSYETKISDNQVISVELRVPLKPSDERYKITKWASTSVDLNYNQNGQQNIWVGN